jgi:hypothetical protein
MMRLPKLIAIGFTVTIGTGWRCAKPLNAMTRMPPAALLTMMTEPSASPTVVVLNRTVSVHEVPGKKLNGQSCDTVNGPVVRMESIVTTALPLLLTIAERAMGAEPSV